MKSKRQNLCRDIILFCRNTDYCNLEKLVETEEELRTKISSRQGDVCRDAEKRRNSGRDR